MAIIETCHPYSHIENPYNYWDTALATTFKVSSQDFSDNVANVKDLMMAINRRVPDKIMSLPLFRDNSDGLTIYNTYSYGQNAYNNFYTRFNFTPDKKYYMGLFKPGSGYAYESNDFYGFDIHLYSSDMINCVYRNEEWICAVHDAPLKENLNFAVMERYRMTTYVSASTNAFWFPNSTGVRTCKQMMTKVVNIYNPSEISYFYAAFNAIDNKMKSNSIPDPNHVYYYDTNMAYIWNGGSFSVIYDGSQLQGGASKAYILRPLILNEWQFTDIFTIEGGIPAYNTYGATIRINDEDYIYLSNSFLLKVT